MTDRGRRLFGELGVSVLETEEALGAAAARRAAAALRERVAAQGRARAVFATGNSQLSFIRALREEADVPWGAVTAFHMDEYVGLTADHSASFRRWIRENVEEGLHPGSVHYIAGDTGDPQAEAGRYEKLLREEPIDLVCMGIGENGHVAFNEPHQADFGDPAWARVIELDDVSRQQQVGEGHFPDLDAVPRQAITLTVPALTSAASLVVSVPERRKAEAVRKGLTGPISNACPASILREHSDATLFLDGQSSALVDAADS